ncbi:MAG: hypothetical protein ACREQV_19660 [Candidatus Binatia bacterium]
MPQIASAYLTAAATLFGVLLTVGVQAVTSATQRRHDRTVKTFDVRLELYAKIRRTIAYWSEAYRITRQLQSELSTLIAKISDLSSNSSDSAGAPSEQAGLVSRETLEQHVKEIEKKVSMLAHHMENLRVAQRELKETSHTVALLAGKPVDEALTNVLDKMASDAKPEKLDFDKFDRAVRQELGAKP